MANWPVKRTIGGAMVEFWKASNLDLSRVYRHFIAAASTAKSADENEMVAAMLSSATYEADRDSLFRTVNIDGHGLIDDPKKLDKVIDAFGLDFEIMLFTEAFGVYLGEASRRGSAPANTETAAVTTPAVPTAEKPLTGSSTGRSSERLPRGAK